MSYKFKKKLSKRNIKLHFVFSFPFSLFYYFVMFFPFVFNDDKKQRGAGDS